MSQLDSLSLRTLKKAEKLGADQAEVFVIDAHTRSVYIESSKPRVADDKSETGMGLKVCMGRHVGFASGTIDKKASDEIVKEALSIARTTEEDPNFKSLPNGKKLSGRVEGVYSEETASITDEALVAKAMNAVKAAEKPKNVKVPLGLIRLVDYRLSVVNSLGVNFNHKGTMVFAHFRSKAAKGDKAGEGIEKAWSTNVAAINFEKMGENAAEKALRTLKAESYREEKKIVAVIAPVELEGMLYPVMFGTNSEQVNKKRSPWASKLGEKVASESLTVWDDGRYSGGIRSALADDEGVETAKKTIIEKGVLQSFIYDSYNASIAGTKATGNAFRRGTRGLEASFSLPAACAYSNMVVKPGNKSLDNLIAGIDNGVLIEAFASPEVNPITGGFGCEIRDATLIEKGSLTKPVKHALLTGNMYEALHNIVAVGSGSKVVENTVLPPMAFSDVMLVGQK
jgi:PmbA protein